MTTVQQAIQAKSTEVAAAIKFKGSDAQQAYAAAIAEYHLAMGAMFTAIRLADWTEYMEGALASWKKTYKVRGGLNAGEFIYQNKPA